MRKKLAAGNWKMNGTSAALEELSALAALHPAPGVEVLICPPATLLSRAADCRGPIAIGAQECHPENSGAHTGDLSAAMLADAGASHVIVGHSERRTDHGETDALIQAKASAATASGLIAVICIGETLAERESGATNTVLATQLLGSVPDDATPTTTVIAYEPVWAIGTGVTPTLDQITETHGFIRATLASRFGTEAAEGFRLLYGGSVKPGNATDIFALPNVDGALVGGASLKAQDFSAIITALEAAT